MSQRGEVIGFVGLGNMGGAICNRLVEAGYSVFVYDLRVEAIQSLVDVGAQSCASAWECATLSLIHICRCRRSSLSRSRWSPYQ